MNLLVVENITQQYGVDAESDEAALKAVDAGTASVIPGTRTVNRRVVVRPEPNAGQARVGPIIQ